MYKHGENQALNVSQQVVFRDIQRDGSGNITSQDVIPIERNHLYKVILTPKYDNGALEFDEIDYAIQVADWQTGETIVFAGDANLTAQSTPSFTVQNALTVSGGTGDDGKTNPTLIWGGVEDNIIYLKVTSQTTGTMLECSDFPSTQYGLVASMTTNDAQGNLVETYQITINDNVENLKDYTFTLSNAINTALSRTFVLRKDAVANIGDFYYTDGTWSTDYIAGKTIAGLVFSTDLSDIDKNTNGFTHGYVVALKDADNSIGKKWNTSGNRAGVNSVHTDTSDKTIVYNSMIADLDGYEHTKYIKDTYASTYTTEYPAFNAALTYNEVTLTGSLRNSGWYLPSIGQWHALCNNFCNKIATWPGTSVQYNSSAYFDYSGISQTTATNLNKYFKQRIETNAGKTSSIYTSILVPTSTDRVAYWTSSEEIETNSSCGVLFFQGTVYQLRFDNNGRTGDYIVRPVLAF